MILLLLLVLNSQPTYNSTDVHLAPEGLKHETTIRYIFQREIGGVRYDPYALHTNRQCYGPGGLCEFGLLPEFHRRGYIDRYNPYEVALYIDSVLEEGRHSNWPYLR